MPTFKGTAEADSTVELVDGTILLGNAVAAADGTWSFTVDTLADGAHPMVARATDAAGNASATTAPLGVRIDSVAPATPRLLAKWGFIPPATDHITASFTFDPYSAASLEVRSGEAHYEKGIDGSSLTSLVGTTGVFGVAFSIILTNSSHTLKIVAVDLAGNIGHASLTLLPVPTLSFLNSMTITGRAGYLEEEPRLSEYQSVFVGAFSGAWRGSFCVQTLSDTDGRFSLVIP